MIIHSSLGCLSAIKINLGISFSSSSIKKTLRLCRESQYIFRIASFALAEVLFRGSFNPILVPSDVKYQTYRHNVATVDVNIPVELVRLSAAGYEVEVQHNTGDDANQRRYEQNHI